MQSHLMKSLVFGATFITLSAFADVPVVDLATNTASTPQQQLSQAIVNPVQESLSLDERVARLEQQVQNIAQMNLSGQISQLQQHIQQLTGQLEVQTHNIKLLNEQQRNFYQDLDQRLSDLKQIVTAGSGDQSTLIPTATTKITSITAKSSDIGQEEQKAYRAAFALLAAKKYDQAIISFKHFLSNYPNGKYVVNAHYWLGEIYSLQGNNEQAAKEFKTVVTQFPKSTKVADSQFKLAVIHAQAGKAEEAKQKFQQIIKAYPNTTAARLAKTQLKQLQ